MATRVPIEGAFTDVAATREVLVTGWRSRTKGKGILEFDAESLLGMYCMDNSLTIAVGSTGIPNDSQFITYLLPGESIDFPMDKSDRIRILFTSDTIPDHEVRYFCPSFDITD